MTRSDFLTAPAPGTWSAPILCALLGLLVSSIAPATESSGSGGINAPQHQGKPHVVLVSLDGFRWDYPELFPSPNIQRLIASGTRAQYLEPVWPTLTFPNHYSQVTGLLPRGHGLVSNDFPLGPEQGWYRLKDRESVEDGRNYGGTPIWVLAEQQGMVAASFFWVGSEADVQGIRPSHWYSFDYTISHEARVDQVVDWLQEPPATRPHIITLYLGIVDHTSHNDGVGSDAMRAAVVQVDNTLGRLMDRIDSLPIADQVYLLVVSDHGQMAYKDDPPFVLDEHIDLTEMAVESKGSAAYAWGLEPQRAHELAQTINAAWDSGMAYTRASAPAGWGITENPRFPDLIMQADAGHAVIITADDTETLSRGDHGWAPEVPQMRGILMARGAGIAAGKTLPGLHSTDVFPILVEWLDLEPPEGFERPVPPGLVRKKP